MLLTPLGEIEITIDNHPIDYTAKKLELSELYQDLAGRYSIVIDFLPDGREHTISCTIKSYIPSEHDSIESGEHFECKAFYSKDIKLSIGMEGDRWIEEKCCYEYENGYLDNGVEYNLLPITKTSKFVFGIAWIEHVNDENEIQTWLGVYPPF